VQDDPSPVGAGPQPAPTGEGSSCTSATSPSRPAHRALTKEVERSVALRHPRTPGQGDTLGRSMSRRRLIWAGPRSSMTTVPTHVVARSGSSRLCAYWRCSLRGARPPRASDGLGREQHHSVTPVDDRDATSLVESHLRTPGPRPSERALIPRTSRGRVHSPVSAVVRASL